MGPEPFVLDISSDEEDAVFDGSGKDSFDCKSSLEWLSVMLELEDVVDVDELNCTAVVQKLSPVRSFMAKLDSDDDCKVLDGDPDKPIDVTQKEGNGSDELLIVGEKGQVACRDFPHSRHLCATFPFGTTSHEKFCKLCHCYVCDVPAPCIYWGTGSSNVDHCHCSDKEEKWRLQRKILRHVNSTAVNTESIAVATPSIRSPGMRSSGIRVPATRTFRNDLPQTMSSTSMHMDHRSVPQTWIPIRGSAPAQTSVPLQNSNSRLHPLRPCSTTSFGTPNIISQRRNQQSGISHSIHRFTQQLNGARKFPGTDDIRKECRGLSPHALSAHARGRMAGAGFINVTTKRSKTTNAKPNQVYPRKLQRSSCLPAPSVDESFREWQDVLLGRDSNPETNLRQCGAYPQPEVDGQTYIQTGPDVGIDLLNSPTPAATSNLNFLDGGWLSAASASTTSHVSLANSPSPYVHPMALYAAPESNPFPGAAAPLEELIGSPGQAHGEPPQEVAGEQGLKELNPCTYDEPEVLNSLLYV